MTSPAAKQELEEKLTRYREFRGKPANKAEAPKLIDEMKDKAGL